MTTYHLLSVEKTIYYITNYIPKPQSSGMYVCVALGMVILLKFCEGNEHSISTEVTDTIVDSYTSHSRCLHMVYHTSVSYSTHMVSETGKL